jgi:DNA-directed RNA polymerase specialized sigma24 family protein
MTGCIENGYTSRTLFVRAMEALVEIGLTRKQATVYARWYAGWSQSQIAEYIGTTQPKVSLIITRAMERVPSLPRPQRQRRFRVKQLSQVAPVAF